MDFSCGNLSINSSVHRLMRCKDSLAVVGKKALCLYWDLVVVLNSTNLHFHWFTPLDLVELGSISVAIMRAIQRVSELWGAILFRNIALSIHPQAWSYCFICLQPCGREGHLMFVSLSFLLVHVRP